MSQLSFSDAGGQAKKRKVTRREAFLNQLESLIVASVHKLRVMLLEIEIRIPHTLS